MIIRLNESDIKNIKMYLGKSKPSTNDLFKIMLYRFVLLQDGSYEGTSLGSFTSTSVKFNKASITINVLDENGQPRNRPFGTINLFEGKLYIQTGKGSFNDY